MIDKSQLQKKSDFLWEIPMTTRADMRVPAHVYALPEIIESMSDDRSLQQLVNVTTLPGIQKAAIVMPDIHEGYGFPIGGIAATLYPDGVISPGGIGYDINCGVRLLVSNLEYDDIKDKAEQIAIELYNKIPSGVGKGGEIKLTQEEMDEVLTEGAEWAVRKKMGFAEDLASMESMGRLKDADPNAVSDHAKKRGFDQLGTIGSGNHFVEVSRVDEIFDNLTAERFGIKNNQIVILIHTGSRGLGHQVATDYLKIMLDAMPNYNIKVPDRELACVPFSSAEGQNYYKAMCAAANFAWCNREVITWEIREAWKQLFPNKNELQLLYDVSHNIAKIEEHEIDGKLQKLIVHRKGATRSFGPRHDEIPERFQETGQPVIIPGSMGTASYILAGTSQSMLTTFGSSCHGAGRALSRRASKRQVNVAHLEKELNEKGIYVRAGSRTGVAEEAPEAYKDIDLVIETVHRANIALKVARLRPVSVIKG
ncbi:MAG TPA: RtcB family protein [Flavobacterium sp.]|uniref:RtcB family protein n=1 Tax=Flavobacterium sp. TaxID=239 RepID=UPI002F3E91F8